MWKGNRQRPYIEQLGAACPGAASTQQSLSKLPKVSLVCPVFVLKMLLWFSYCLYFSVLTVYFLAFPEPSKVDLQVVDVGVTSVKLKWKVNDNASHSYTYRIEIANVKNETLNHTETEITGLIPGTNYSFTVFVVVSDNQTEGGASISQYTRPSQVLDLQVVDVGETFVNLTWEVNDNPSDPYTYRIEVANGTSVWNKTSNVKKADIDDLIPGTNYNFTVFAVAADEQTEGEGASISQYTSKSQVLAVMFLWVVLCCAARGCLVVAESWQHCWVALVYAAPLIFNLHVVDVGETFVNLTWEVNDSASDTYTYRIEVVNGTSPRNRTSEDKKADIDDLTPGTNYSFTVFAVAADGQTEGEGASDFVFCFNLEMEATQDDYSFLKFSFTSPLMDKPLGASGAVTFVNLTWEVNDNPSDPYTYRIEVANGTSVWNKTSNVKKADIDDLIPGTNYNFTVFAVAADGQTEGEGASISQYTSKSRVLAVMFLWVVLCCAARGSAWRVKYSLLILTNTYPTPVFSVNLSAEELAQKGVCVFSMLNTLLPHCVAKELINRKLFFFFSFCAVPSPVNSFQCEPVANMSYLMLKWECPYGNYSGFIIKIYSANSSVITEESQSCSEGFKTSPLDYFKTYNVTVTTFSNGITSSPVQKTCKTSITDPPAPKEPPVVKVLSYNSFSVEFSDFEAVYGPLKAYAVMIITEEGCPPLKSKLNYTYEDFKKKKTGTYVTYVIETEKAKLPSFRSQHIINVGKGNTMYGYKNGPLTPLHSYRASVAGFTNINFTAENIIMEEYSYVSFSPCSNKVSLPQDPGVIAGAVIGCLLAILAVVAIVGYIFWTRRRKDKRNTEVSFSPIKSKMIKVENFESYFKKQQADSNCGFAEEYEELKSTGVHQTKSAAENPDNRGKNRYNNVLPYDISRVKLSDLNSGSGDYINANYMPGYISKKAFIAAQGPLANTTEDFWRMIWEKSIYCIVMLTKCVEQARTKCEQYWPDKQSKTYGDIAVTVVLETVLPEWTIRDFNVENANTGESRTVRQFHFTSWPDHGVPETTDLLINFRHHVHEYSSQNPIDSPVLVHCSAGVGRTGTFIAIDRLIQQIEMENTVDVYGVVYDLRMHRPLMVQTEDQYVFLNQCVMDIIRSQKDKKTDLIYQNTTAMAIYENFKPAPEPAPVFGKANGYHA
uniref:Receptor-type tyrosine-protein phosphatase eta n=1 Tax=Anas zonorhyncha TaxID=75864 RepID=A0A8B9VFW1_9AVES